MQHTHLLESGFKSAGLGIKTIGAPKYYMETVGGRQKTW